MKKIISFILAALLAFPSARIYASAEKSGAAFRINQASVSFAQAESCMLEMLESFDKDGSAVKAAEETSAKTTESGYFEGDGCLEIRGKGSASVVYEPSSRIDMKNARSVAVCVYINSPGDADVKLSVTTADSEISAYTEISGGEWKTLYLPINGAEYATKIGIAVTSQKDAEINALIDYLHTAKVDGMPENLRYFASDFTASGGKLDYTDEGIVFTPESTSGYIDSSYCGYMTNGKYNTIEIKLTNDSDAEKVSMYLMLDGEKSYTDAGKRALDLAKGSQICRFFVSSFRSGSTVESFRLSFPEISSGTVTIESICFSSFRYPEEYGGEVTVEVTAQNVIVSGKLSPYPLNAESVKLYRLCAGQDEEMFEQLDISPTAGAKLRSSFVFVLDRYEDGVDNGLFKYYVKYEGKDINTPAGISFAKTPEKPGNALGYKGAVIGFDASLIHALSADTAYIDCDAGSIFSAEGVDFIEYAGKKLYISEKEAEKLDNAVKRCEEEGADAVIRLLCSAPSELNGLYISYGNSSLPDLTATEGTEYYAALLRFICERYKGKIKAVIPFDAPDLTALTETLDTTPDRASKYISSVINFTRYLLYENGVDILIPADAENAAEWLSMAELDVKELYSCGFFVTCKAVDGLESAYGLLEGASISGVVCYTPENATEAVLLYFGSYKRSAGVCVNGSELDAEAKALYTLASSSYGLSAASLAADINAYDVYTERPPYKDRLEYKGIIYPEEELPSNVHTVFDGYGDSGWSIYDGCKNIFSDSVNGEPSLQLAFDFSGSAYGYAAYTFDTPINSSSVYLKLYADHLPDSADGMEITVTAECENGVASGVCTLRKDKTACITLGRTHSIGKIITLTIGAFANEEDGTPRICVLGIYAPDPSSEETATEAEEATVPDPETQNFTTDGNAENGGNTGLYLIVIAVIISVFAVIGAVILILKKKSEKNKE